MSLRKAGCMQMMSRHKRRAVLACIFTVCTVSACGRQQAASAEVSSVPVTLHVVTMFGGTDPNAPVYEQISEEFQKHHPEIVISDESGISSEQWKASVVARFSAGDEPDVLQFFTDATADQLVAMDKFVTLSEIRAAYPEYAADTYEWALSQVANSDGVERAVPTTGYWEGLYCNLELFEEYDIPLPTDWTSFADAVSRFREKKIIPVACALSSVPHYWMEYLLLYSAGTDLYTRTWTTVPQEYVNGLRMFQTLRQMGAFPEDADTISNEYAQTLFEDKKAAMILEGNWYLPAIRDQDHTTVIAFPGVPQQKAKAGTVVGGMTSGFYISRRAWNDPDKRDAAVAFVMANTDKDAVQRYWEHGGGSATAAVKVIRRQMATPLSESAERYIRSAPETVLSTDSRMAPRAYRELIAGILNVSDGSSPEQLLEKVTRLNGAH
ncbi:MAG: extracellular solute-binding protein [Butyrivibrio sp.]|nr:extracellular solute-binding protein [Butyrivibrio sp.]